MERVYIKSKLRPYSKELIKNTIYVADNMISFFSEPVTIVSYCGTDQDCCQIKEDNGVWYWHRSWFVDRDQDFRMLKPII